MSVRWNIPLPGPFSVGGNVGGGRPGPSATEQIDGLRTQRALTDLYCPEHLRAHNGIGWIMLAVTGLIATLVTWWALPVWGVLAALTWGRHRFRDQRRAPHLAVLAGGSGCEVCRKAEAKAARSAELNPLAQLAVDQPTDVIPAVPARPARHRR